ncbi:MAG: DNA polymerase III subunit delta [Clostridia bacterium]|nr:DNA polymerase III subunit delta [Clostridia bacterium]
MTITYDDFRALLKSGDLTNLYLFIGEEVFLQEFCVTGAKKALIDPAFADFNCKEYIELPSFDDASSFISALPLMSAKKLVVFNNCALFERKISEKSRWAELFSNLPSYVTVIIRENGESKGAATEIKKAVTKMAVTVDFKLLTAERLRPWLVKLFASKGKSISSQNASYIVSSVGRSMTTLRTEAEKIVAKSENFEISRRDIDSVIIKPLTETVFKLIDALFSSRPDLCYKILSTLRQTNQEPVAVISVIASQTLVIYKAKLMLTGHKSISEVKKALGGGFSTDKAVDNASKVPLTQIEALICALRKADFDTKNGIMDPWCALDLIIAAR